MSDDQYRPGRGEQLRLIEDWQPVPMKANDGQTVRPAAQAAVLDAINKRAGDGGECFANQDTLARMAKVSDRHVRRAVQVLHCLGVITWARRTRGRDTRPLNHHRIVWTRLRELVDHQPPDGEQPDVPTEATGRVDRSNRTYRPEQPDVPTEATGRVDRSNRTYRPEQPDVPSEATGRSVRLSTSEPTMTHPSSTTTTEPLRGEWLRLRDVLFELGMEEAASAAITARDDEWSVHGVRELLSASPGVHPGKLCKWLKGDPGRPFGPEEAEQRYRDRLAREAAAEQQRQAERVTRADTIRNEVSEVAAARSPRPSADAIAAAIVRKLSEEQLIELITDDERERAESFERNCRDRSELQSARPEPPKPPPSLDASIRPLIDDAKQTTRSRPPKQPPRAQPLSQRREELARQIADLQNTGSAPT